MTDKLSKEEVHLKGLVAKRERLFRRAQLAYDSIGALPEKKEIFLARASVLEGDLDKLEKLQDDIFQANLNVPTESRVSVGQTSTTYEEVYFAIKAKFESFASERPAVPAPEPSELRPKLPRIDLPKFKGDLEKFPAFRSLFDTLVHNTKLPNIQKFSFLKSYLEGPALDVINHLELTPENYDTAYKKIIARYTDKRLVGTHLLNKLLQFKPLPNGSSASLRQFEDVFCVHYESIRALQLADLADFIIFNIAWKVLDADTKRLFEQKNADKDFPKYDDLVSFVSAQRKIVSMVQSVDSKPAIRSGQYHPNPGFGGANKPSYPGTSFTKSFLVESNRVAANSSTSTQNVLGASPTCCPLCQGSHRIYSCHKFMSMPLDERLKGARKFHLCFSCLGYHARSSCQSKLSCRKCNDSRHHTLLHRDTGSHSEVHGSGTPSIQENTVPTADLEKQSTNSLNCRIQTPDSGVSKSFGLMGTAKVRVLSSAGVWLPCRLVVDPASESSFITDSMVQSLGLPRKKGQVNVIGVGSTTFSNHRGSVRCKVSPWQVEDPSLNVDAIVLQTIASELPKLPLPPALKQRFRHIQLADPDFDKPGPVDMLLGVQHYSEILSSTPIHIPGSPAALSSIFGFIIFGKIPTNEVVNTQVSFFTQSPPIEETLHRFWEIEEPLPTPTAQPEEDECEEYFCKTVSRDHLGRYVVSLPFRKGKVPSALGSTQEVAHKRLLSLERRLTKNPALKEQYQEFMHSYIAQDHMRLARSIPRYHLTHHAVLKDSSTTKLRVVFNGSEKSDTGHCLNEYLLPGPKLQTDLFQILLRFRLKPVALTGGIKQMFRCIRLTDEDMSFVHVLWREHHTERIKEWEMTTLPFGLNCSPYLAQRVIKQLLDDEGSPFPDAVEALKINLYVDDFVCACDSVSDAVEMYTQVSKLLSRGGFLLRKSASNSPVVLSHIPQENRETSISFDEPSYIKLLGLVWNPVTDIFEYRFSNEPPIVTKRGILSQVSRLYDVNGYVAPIIFWCKCFLQRLWVSGIDWDAELPVHLRVEWLNFYRQFPAISSIRIPRYVQATMGTLSLVGFCDASERGYAACVFLRVDVGGKVHSHLLRAKSKVAPLKTLTIPRLELNGALLLAKLLVSLQDLFPNVSPENWFGFTDSTVVLAWLRTPTHQLKTYISNRVGQILEVLPINGWRHVSGVSNPADVASRGTFPQNLVKNKLWWHGPKFIRNPITHWNTTIPDLDCELPETKTDSHCLLSDRASEVSDDNRLDWLISRQSSLSKLQRVMAYVSRFVNNARIKREHRTTGDLKIQELSTAMDALIGCTQRGFMSDTIRDVEQHRIIKGSLRTLTPFLDKKGLLRVGGRLALAPLDEDSKHPVLLHKKSRLALLIAEYYHKLTLHGGIQLMQCLIQRKFWIVGIRSLLRGVSFRCVSCYRFHAKPLEPLMSSLPADRFQKLRPFLNIGVDLAGPYSVKESKRRNARSQKAWVVLFICQSTRAVYIDLVSDLTTAAFLASLDRFTSRRGLPQKIRSDLGTNFVGAARELKEIAAILKNGSEELRDYCKERSIEWIFNPPAAPNFGGSWEAGIKSMKRHLRRVLGDKSLTYEEYSTLLAKVEAILNSRPLCALSSSPSDGFDYLTPGHFLVGAPLILSRPEETLPEAPISLKTRWHLITRCAQDIWKRWSREYLQTLIQRPKWCHKGENIKVGSLVLLVEKSLPPNKWELGRVSEVMTGQDHVVRVVKLKTTRGYITRPLNKLSILPV